MDMVTGWGLGGLQITKSNFLHLLMLEISLDH